MGVSKSLNVYVFLFSCDSCKSKLLLKGMLQTTYFSGVEQVTSGGLFSAYTFWVYMLLIYKKV